MDTQRRSLAASSRTASKPSNVSPTTAPLCGRRRRAPPPTALNTLPPTRVTRARRAPRPARARFARLRPRAGRAFREANAGFRRQRVGHLAGPASAVSINTWEGLRSLPGGRRRIYDFNKLFNLDPACKRRRKGLDCVLCVHIDWGAAILGNTYVEHLKALVAMEGLSIKAPYRGSHFNTFGSFELEVSFRVPGVWTPRTTWRKVDGILTLSLRSACSLQRHIGSGGFGEVYSGKDPENSPVAIKLMDAESRHSALEVALVSLAPRASRSGATEARSRLRR